MALELFRAAFSAWSRKGANSKETPDPTYNTGWTAFIVCAPVLIALFKLLLPLSAETWLAELSGPNRSRDLRQAIINLGPLVVLYFPAYYYFFASKHGRAAQAAFDLLVAADMDSNLSAWRGTLFGVFIISMVPGMFATRFPIPAALSTIALILVTSTYIRRRIGRASV